MLWVVVQVFEWKFVHLMNFVSLPLVTDCVFKIRNTAVKGCLTKFQISHAIF